MQGHPPSSRPASQSSLSSFNNATDMPYENTFILWLGRERRSFPTAINCILKSFRPPGVSVQLEGQLLSRRTWVPTHWQRLLTRARNDVSPPAPLGPGRPFESLLIDVLLVPPPVVLTVAGVRLWFCVRSHGAQGGRHASASVPGEHGRKGDVKQ